MTYGLSLAKSKRKILGGGAWWNDLGDLEAKHSKQGSGYYADLHPGHLHGLAFLKT